MSTYHASGKRRRWNLAFAAAVVVVIVTLIPQIVFWFHRGVDWQGSYVCVDPDEFAYSAYVSSLISGKNRLDNPYTGQPAETTLAKRENLFSIQFFPPYILALLARLSGLSASAIFIVVVPMIAFATSLVIFWLLLELTKNETTSAIGVLIMLLCGVIVSEHLFLIEKHYYTFGFLRRYIPAIPVPLFFLFCLFVWRAFTRQRTSSVYYSLAAGTTFSLLVYSYFYVWTAAAAWLGCLTLLWWLGRSADRKQALRAASIITALGLAALVPYFDLLSRRAETTDGAQGLVFTRVPDLLRSTEILGVLILFTLAWFVFRKKLDYRSPELLFAVSCLALPLLVFNQQIITGYSLQPFHYEQFIINYVVLLGAVVSYSVIRRSAPKRPILWIAVALGVGFATALRSSTVSFEINERTDRAVPIYQTLEKSSQSKTGVVLIDNPMLATAAPTYASIPVLWAPHMYTFGTTTSADEVERFYQYLYFTGIDADQISSDPELKRLFTMTLFGLVRVNPKLSIKFNPVTDGEITEKLSVYSHFSTNFSQEHVARWPLSFVVLEDGLEYDLSNLDRWYERDDGYRTGGGVIYRVRLRRAIVDSR